MTYSYLNIQKQKNKQILNYIKHEKSTITSKRDTHSSYWTGDVNIYIYIYISSGKTISYTKTYT